jgi:hypothetical protein
MTSWPNCDFPCVPWPHTSVDVDAFRSTHRGTSLPACGGPAAQVDDAMHAAFDEQCGDANSSWNPNECNEVCERYANSMLMCEYYTTEKRVAEKCKIPLKNIYKLHEAVLNGDPSRLEELNGSIFKWHWVMESDSLGGGTAVDFDVIEQAFEDAANHPTRFPKNLRYVFSMNMNEEPEKEYKRLDLYYIARSQLYPERLGVHAARQFDEGNIVGFMVGVPIWACSRKGTRPVRELSACQSPFVFCRPNKEYCQTIFDPLASYTDGNFAQPSGWPRYLGLHYINQPTKVKYYRDFKGDKEKTSLIVETFDGKDVYAQHREANCVLMEDCAVVACHGRLTKNQEILIADFNVWQKPAPKKTPKKRKHPTGSEQKVGPNIVQNDQPEFGDLSECDSGSETDEIRPAPSMDEESTGSGKSEGSDDSTFEEFDILHE